LVLRQSRPGKRGEYSRANSGGRAGDTSYQDHFSLPRVIRPCVNRLNVFDVEIVELSNSKCGLNRIAITANDGTQKPASAFDRSPPTRALACATGWNNRVDAVFSGKVQERRERSPHHL
jgi:hypothetical protein